MSIYYPKNTKSKRIYIFLKYELNYFFTTFFICLIHISNFQSVLIWLCKNILYLHLPNLSWIIHISWFLGNPKMLDPGDRNITCYSTNPTKCYEYSFPCSSALSFEWFQYFFCCQDWFCCLPCLPMAQWCR